MDDELFCGCVFETALAGFCKWCTDRGCDDDVVGILLQDLLQTWRSWFWGTGVEVASDGIQSLLSTHCFSSLCGSIYFESVVYVAARLVHDVVELSFHQITMDANINQWSG